VRRRFTALPAESAYASVQWRARIIGIDNDHGVSLERQLRLIRIGDRRNGGNDELQLNIDSAAYDDLLTRGHGDLHVPPNLTLYWDSVSPRHGAWSHEVEAKITGNQLNGIQRPGYELTWLPTYFINDAFNVFTGVTYGFKPNWLIWQHDNLIGSFDSHEVLLDAGLNWAIGGRQELRIKLQALGLDARLLQAYRVGADRRAHPSDDAVNDFSVRNLGFQIRYRYELAPLSDLYVVYGRGGYALDPLFRGAETQFNRSFDLRDSEQLLVKLAYRFEI
jgi:hypothetical protein